MKLQRVKILTDENIFIRLRYIKPADVARVCETVLQMDIDVFPGTIAVIEETKIRIRHLSANQ